MPSNGGFVWMHAKERERERKKERKNRIKSHIRLNDGIKCSSGQSFVIIISMHFCITHHHQWLWFVSMRPYSKWPVVRSIKHFQLLCKCWIVKSYRRRWRRRRRWWTMMVASVANLTIPHHMIVERCHRKWLYYFVCSSSVTWSRWCSIFIYFFCVIRQQNECSSKCIDMLNKFVIALPFSRHNTWNFPINTLQCNLMDLCLMSPNEWQKCHTLFLLPLVMLHSEQAMAMGQ